MNQNYSLIPRPVPSFSVFHIEKQETLKSWELAWGQGYQNYLYTFWYFSIINLGQKSSGNISSEAWKPTLSPEIEEDLRQRIHCETKTMKHRFSVLQTLIRNNLKTEDVNPKALATHIIGMHILSEEHEKIMEKASRLQEIFNILTKYCSFLDFSHLESIVEIFCSDKCVAKKELDEYKYAVQHFCERRVSEFPQGSLNSGTDIEGMDKLVVVLDLKDPSLKRVLNLKEVIANILGQPPSKLVLYNIGIGSIVVTFLIATSLGEKLFLETTGTAKTLTQKQEDQSLEINMVSMKFLEITVFSIHQQLKKGNARLCVNEIVITH